MGRERKKKMKERSGETEKKKDDKLIGERKDEREEWERMKIGG